MKTHTHTHTHTPSLSHTDTPSHTERERERLREILKFGISLWHIDKHGAVLTARERERERERERGGRFKSFMYCSSAWTSSGERQRDRQRVTDDIDDVDTDTLYQY